MKSTFIAAMLALTFAATAGFAQTAPPAAPPGPDLEDLAARLQDAQDKIADLEKRLDTVEQRLGESYRPPSPFDTIERRLDDLEKDVDDLKGR